MLDVSRMDYVRGVVQEAGGRASVMRVHFEHSLLLRDQLLLDYPDDPNEWHLKLDRCFSLFRHYDRRGWRRVAV